MNEIKGLIDRGAWKVILINDILREVNDLKSIFVLTMKILECHGLVCKARILSK